MKHRRDKFTNKNKRRDSWRGGKRNLIADCPSCHYGFWKYKEHKKRQVLDLSFREQLTEL